MKRQKIGLKKEAGPVGRPHEPQRIGTECVGSSRVRAARRARLEGDFRAFLRFQIGPRLRCGQPRLSRRQLFAQRRHVTSKALIRLSGGPCWGLSAGLSGGLSRRTSASSGTDTRDRRCRPPPPAVQERRERAAKARRSCGDTLRAPSRHGINARKYPFRAFAAAHAGVRETTRPRVLFQAKSLPIRAIVQRRPWTGRSAGLSHTRGGKATRVRRRDIAESREGASARAIGV
jgi:hypothetical protein